MRSTRMVVDAVAVGDDPLEPGALAYADVFVVVRDGHALPGPNDWEVNLQTVTDRRLAPGRYELRLDAADGSEMVGGAVLRYSDGRRHLFRGDGPLDGFVDEGTFEAEPDL